MNTIRMLAFVAAVLITAFLFRVIADGATPEQPIQTAPAVAATGAAASDGPQSAAN
jgi:hypothetical protein